MSDQYIIEQIKAYGIDYERLKKCLDQPDDWGGMVHSFEYLTVLSVVEIAMRDGVGEGTE